MVTWLKVNRQMINFDAIAAVHFDGDDPTSHSEAILYATSPPDGHVGQPLTTLTGDDARALFTFLERQSQATDRLAQ